MITTAYESRYRHDCNKCVYLGRDGLFDLYYCADDDDILPMLIARDNFGTDFCNIQAVPQPTPQLEEAKLRAEAFGYGYESRDTRGDAEASQQREAGTVCRRENRPRSSFQADMDTKRHANQRPEPTKKVHRKVRWKGVKHINSNDPPKHSRIIWVFLGAVLLMVIMGMTTSCASKYECSKDLTKKISQCNRESRTVRPGTGSAWIVLRCANGAEVHIRGRDVRNNTCQCAKSRRC